MPEWSHLFVGRDAEIELLKRNYADAAKGKPRVVSIVAESGFGKTRLVQEFYNWLSTHHDAVGGDGYWPDRLLKKENNLLVNPDSDECGLGAGKMPFLWWGLRLSDPTARNEIVAGALWAGLDILKPHLGLYSRSIQKENLAKSLQGSLASGAIDLALDAVGNLVTFGLLSTGKTVLEKGKELYDLHRSNADLDLQDFRPHATQQRANDELSDTILADLYRLAKRPPKGLSPIPLVVVLDDAQWLAQDAGMATFATALLRRARAEEWPLLLVITSWEREWRESEHGGGVPASLQKDAAGEVIHLSRTPGLEEIVALALPGLPPEQSSALVQQVDGNPRFLDEIQLFLHRNRKYFVGRDLSAPLTVGGLGELAKMSFPDFVADRFAEAPDHVRRALALASTHGVAFSPRMVKYMAEHLNISDATTGLSEGENPHGFATLEDEEDAGEFRMRAYRNAAADDLGNHLDEEEVQRASEAARTAVLTDLAQASEQDLGLVFEADLQHEALTAAAELIRRANERHDPRSAGEIAKSALLRFPTLSESAELRTIFVIVDAQWAWDGPTKHTGELLRGVVDRTRQADSDPSGIEQRRQLTEALSRLGIAVETFEGPAAARSLHLEAVILCHALVEEQDTPEAQRSLAVALLNLGNVVEALEGPVAARPTLEETTDICRVLVTEQRTPEAQRELAVALSRLGDVIEALEGPAAARPAREEATDLFRVLAAEQGTPGARNYLANALARLGNVVEALEGPAAARPMREEETELCRVLATDQGTPGARRDLANALARLGNVVEALEGAAAARSMREEETKLCRILATEQDTPGARHGLALALSRLGDVVEALEGPAAARPLREEETDLCRVLAAEQGTPGAQRSLALALSRLGNVVEALEGAAAARSMREEETKLCRVLATEQDIPGARRDLANALTRLGDMAEALEGPAAARPVREEATDLFRVLAAEQGTPATRRGLALALSRLGNVVEALEGPTAARPTFEEATDMCRVLVSEQGTPRARSDLTKALACLGDVVAALEGPAAARPLCEEETDLCRVLVIEQSTPRARSDLANALSRLGDVIEALEGPAAARPLREEETDLCRVLVTEQGTPRARSGLANALARLGNVIEALEGPAAARSMREEETDLCRVLVTEQGTPGARRGLANALSRLGNVVEALEGPAAARSMRQEETDLCRVLATEQGTPGARRGLANALSRLGDIVEALEGAAAASPQRKEAHGLFLELQRSSDTPDVHLYLNIITRSWLRAELLGVDSWNRPFATEIIEHGVAQSVLENIKALVLSFENWAERVGSVSALGWVETVRIDLARCHHATGNYQDAVAIAEDALPAFRLLAERTPTSGLPLLTQAHFVAARASSASGEDAAARSHFEQALRLCRSTGQEKAAKEIRLHAAAAWFYAQHLKQHGAADDVTELLVEGHIMARTFAKFGMQDGAAILSAFETAADA